MLPAMRAGMHAATEIPLGVNLEQVWEGIGISIGDVEVSRDAARRATPPRVVRAELFARLLGSRRVRSAAPRVAALLAEVRQDLVDHRGLRDERHDPHGPVMVPWHVGHASGSTSKICCSNAAHRCVASVGASRGGGGLRPAPHPARPIGVPPVLPRGHLPLVRDVGQHPREKL